GMNRGTNIFDLMEASDIAYHVSDPVRSEEENRDRLIAEILGERIDFAFVYWPELDGLLHRVGNRSPEISPKLHSYEQWIELLLSAARAHYDEVRLYVFSDHGMADCVEHLDLKRRIDALPV